MDKTRTYPWILATLLLFGLIYNSHAEAIPFVWMDEPGREDSVNVLEDTSGMFLDIEDLAQHLDVPQKVGKNEFRLLIELPSEKLIFACGLPFVQVNGQLHQMPFALKPKESGFYAPIESVIELIAEYYPGDLHYDPTRRRVLASHPTTDILGVRYVHTPDNLLAIITAGKQLHCESDKLTESEIVLFFPDGSIDTSGFNQVINPSGIRGIFAEQTRKGAQITLNIDERLTFEQFEILSDPPVYIVTFRQEYDIEMNVENNVINKLKEEQSQWDFDVVVIDPGHGGKDPGAVGATKLLEKTVVLDVALMLRDFLEDKGIQTIMTRDKDVFIPLAERTKIANSSGGKLFVSLHCNATAGRRARGVETFFLSPSKNETAMRVAMKENDVIKYEDDQDQYQALNEETFILLSMTQANFIRESQDLAVVVQEKVSAGTKLKNRGVDQAEFYVLYGANMPSVLIELGFISNKTEEKKLKSKDFRKETAAQICNAVMAFLENSRENGL
ncbi:MAG: N-acetylmuramoyl-L-alanine amidase [Calditrichaeota bacterium]|nr:N-acetylmuramoyl-L-alanine amidase [Calditrichota bacterium]